jgi:hypothetical protein
MPYQLLLNHMSTIILQEALDYLDIFREYVVDNDIRVAIRANAGSLLIHFTEIKRIVFLAFFIVLIVFLAYNISYSNSPFSNIKLHVFS